MKSFIVKTLIIVIVLVTITSAVYVYEKDKAETMVRTDNLMMSIEDLKNYILEADMTLSDRLSATESALGILSEDAKAIAEMQSTLKAESAESLSALSKEIKSTQLSFDLSSIIEKWRPFIAKVECTWITGSQKATISGSGFLFKTKLLKVPHMVTNRHIVLRDKIKPDYCKVTFSGVTDSIEVKGKDILYSTEGYDFGVLKFDETNQYINMASETVAKYPICSSAEVGGQVIIMGYPSIGLKDAVTATEGIIAGIEDYYFITSAKVEQGNSGGAAILVQPGGESCYLGIPTFAQAGKLEALARILSVKVFK